MVFSTAKLHSITAVLLCHTFLCVNGSVSTSTASSSTSSSANGQSSDSLSYSTSLSISAVSTSTFTIAPSSSTSPPPKGQSSGSLSYSTSVSTGAISTSPTSTLTIAPSSSASLAPAQGQLTSTTPPSSNTVSPTSTSTPSSTTSSPGDGQSTTLPSSTPVPPTSTSTPSSTTSPPANGQSTTPPSSTTVLPTSTSAPSSTTSSPANGQLITTSSSTTVLPSSTSTPSSATSLPATSQSTTPSSSTTVLPTSTSTPSSTTPPSGESTTPSSSTTVPPTSTSTPSSTTPPPGGDQSTTPSSSTTVPPTSTSTPSSTTSPPGDDVGAQVNITLYVRVSNCSEASHEDVSSPEYRDLERNLKGNLTEFYTRNGVNYALTIILQITLCIGKYVKVVVTITFKLQFTIGFNIEEDIKQGIRNNSLGSLPVDGTRVEVTFIGNFTSSTTVPLISTTTPSPTTSPPCEAVVSQVSITVYIRVSNCSGASHENVSSPEYRDLERNLKGNLTEFYTRKGVNYALTIILQTTQCMGNFVKVVVRIIFKLGIGFNITEDIKTEVSNNSLASLPVNGSRTLVEIAFIDVGAQVNITIYVRVSNCSGASHENVSSLEYRDLERNLKGNLTDFYTRDGVNYALIIILQTTQCMGNYVKVVVTITFKLGIGFNIEGDIKKEVSNNSLVSLPVNGTLVEVAFICQSSILPSSLPSSSTVSRNSISIPSKNTSPADQSSSSSTTNPVTPNARPSSTSTSSSTTSPPVAPPTFTSTSSSTTSPPECINITYNIKEGECDRVCCDGAGGPVKMIPTCKSRSDDSCCGEEKEENGHCPGEPEDLCSGICDGSASSVQYPSFALVGLLAVATFFK